MASSELATTQRALRGNVPDFFIVGHAKCGTTALYETLRRHPEIFMPDVKEPMFFARNPPSGARSNRFERTGVRSETQDEYLSLFAAAGADQRVGEASTFYLWSHAAPARIAAAQPGARIIAILREPASFLRSLHLQMLQNHAEVEQDLLKAIALEKDRREGRRIPRGARWPEALIYSERVRYVDQLRRYHDVFPRSNVLVLIYDDFRRENEATVRGVLRFLDVDDSLPLQMPEANPSVTVRLPRVDTLIRDARSGAGPVSRATRATVKALTTMRLRSRLLHPLRQQVLYGSPPPPDEAVMIELRRRFRGEVVALSEYLGRDLVALWGYDRVG
jgi:sulfotransferase family protein